MPAYPRNILSGKPYGGVVPILLQIAADALGCSSPWWGTIAEWTSVGSKVRFGIGVRVPGVNVPLHNWEFTDRACQPPPLPVEDPNKIFDAIIKGLGVKIEHGFDATCKYCGAEDKIRIPHKWMFEIGPGGSPGYWDSLAHEATHASEPRLKWDGHPDVAELRAEIGAGYLCGLLGVSPLPLHLRRHHDAHVARWISLLKDDSTLLLRVCDSASEAIAYLLRFADRDIKWHPPEM
jgi:antirestriction protein ArdC